MQLTDLITAPIAKPDCDINHILAYGPPRSCEGDSWPVVLRHPRHDTLMLGRGLQSAGYDAENRSPAGAPRLRPLVGTQQLPIAVTETILECAVNEWRGRALGAGDATIGARRLLAGSCVAGAGSTDYPWNNAVPDLSWLRRCALSARDASHAMGYSYAITALLLLHDTYHTMLLDDASPPDAAARKDRLRSLCRDVMAEAVGITDQRTRPVIFTSQTSACATGGNTMPTAELEVALECPTFVMVAPVYPLPHTPSGQLDVNGCRWLGAQFGKVMHQVLNRGDIFRPTHPIFAFCQDTIITVDFAVPVPPLAWETPVTSNPGAIIPNRGFTVQDQHGDIPIESVEIQGPETIRITVRRKPEADASLAYASARTGGRGSLHDSDTDVSADRYLIGPTPAPALEGKPYPLWNWCVAFNMKISIAS